jgi:hypothetical protein
MLRSTLSSSLCFALLGALGLTPIACGGSPEGTTPGGSGKHPTCTNPSTDAAGVVTCDEGYTYLETSPLCSTGANADAQPAPRPNPLPRVTNFVDCTNDASVCDAYAYGYCGGITSPGTMRGCASGCGSDADCEGNGRCNCSANDGHGACMYDSCFSDSECATGFHCASTAAGCGTTGFICQTAKDECFGQRDCPGGQFCVVNDGVRKCGFGSVCGRPFLVLSEARVAPTVRGGAWLTETPTPRLTGLSDAERRAQAEHWTRMGQLEHGSIAAFARFSLQLLALGAPPDLVEACTQALADETAHARLCFSLASAYAGYAVGPGPLDVSGSLQATSLLEVVDLVLAEGCFGEAGAALEALEAAERESDPVLIAAYRRIAADEQRHAELAFRFVRWALERQGDSVMQCIEAALAAPPCENAGAIEVATSCLSALLATIRAAA